MVLNSTFRSQLWSSYVGVLFHHWRPLMLVGWLIAAADVTFLIIHADKLWLEGWLAFWREPNLASWAAIVCVLPVLTTWIIVPVSILFGTSSASGYVRYRSDDSLHIGLLVVSSCVATGIHVIAVPTIAVVTWSGYVRSVAALLSVSTAATALGLARRFAKHLEATGTSFLVPIRQFPTELRPQNTRVLNVDCGALAPRLNVVAEGLDAWSRLVNGSAPTAKLWWDAVSNPRAQLPRQWQKNLKGRAWTGIEAFRRNVAELVQVDPAAVVLLPSTTRSCQAIVNSLPVIETVVTTTMEHPSEERLFALLTKARNVSIKKVDTFDLLKSGTLFKEAPAAFGMLVKDLHNPLVLLSEIPYTAGVRMPVAEIITSIKQACPSAVVIVDGAHAVGHVPVNVAALNADCYIFSGHKWLFGPASLGVCIVGESMRRNAEFFERLSLECFESLALLGSRLGESGSTIPLEPFVGLAEFLGTVSSNGLMRDVYENIYAVRRLLEAKTDSKCPYELIYFSGVDADRLAPGIVNVQARPAHFSEAGLQTIRDFLEDRFDVVAKVVRQPTSLRLCLPFYLNYAEADRLHNALCGAFATAPLVVRGDSS